MQAAVRGLVGRTAPEPPTKKKARRPRNSGKAQQEDEGVHDEDVEDATAQKTKKRPRTATGTTEKMTRKE